MTKRLPRIKPEPRSDSEPFTRGGESLGPTLLAYWQWSGSDLVSNVERGVLAEFLVASAMKLTVAPREEWGAFDLEVPSCGTVEVKSAAYIQSWEQRDFSRISFDIARRESAWNPETGKYKKHDSAKRNADVYVFCLLKHRCQKTIDPLDVDQWEFYVVPKALLDCERGNGKGIALNALKELTGAVPYGELSNRVREVFTNLAPIPS